MTLWIYLLVFCAGVVGSMGLGGGTILIPTLIFFAKISQHSAQAINLLAFIPLAIISIILHSKNKLIKFKPALFCSLFSGLTSIAASFFAQKIEGEILSKILGGLMIALGVFYVVVLIKKKKKYKK